MENAPSQTAKVPGGAKSSFRAVSAEPARTDIQYEGIARAIHAAVLG